VNNSLPTLLYLHIPQLKSNHLLDPRLRYEHTSGVDVSHSTSTNQRVRISFKSSSQFILQIPQCLDAQVGQSQSQSPNTLVTVSLKPHFGCQSVADIRESHSSSVRLESKNNLHHLSHISRRLATSPQCLIEHPPVVYPRELNITEGRMIFKVMVSVCHGPRAIPDLS
jgi:hypothetical protein